MQSLSSEYLLVINRVSFGPTTNIFLIFSHRG